MEFVVHDLANALQGLGHEVTVFAPVRRDDREEEPHDYELSRFGWKFRGAYRLGLNRWPLRRSFSRSHARRPFDAINSHSAYLATTYALGLGDRFGLPVIATCHGSDIQQDPAIGYGVRLDPKSDRLVRSNLDRVSAAVSISSSMHVDLAELVPEEKIVSIANGIWLPESSPAITPWLRTNVGARQDEMIIISVGRNVPKKSFEIGLRAFAEALRTTPNLRYVHIGRDGEPLQRLACELGVSDRYHALGERPRNDVIVAYQESDIFFSPAAVESFGIVTFEAMAAGLPSVVSDGPGNRDAITDGRTGLVVPVGDSGAMARALIDLAQDSPRRISYGQEAKLAVTDFSWDNIAAEYVEAFSSAKLNYLT